LVGETTSNGIANEDSIYKRQFGLTKELNPFFTISIERIFIDKQERE